MEAWCWSWEFTMEYGVRSLTLLNRGWMNETQLSGIRTRYPRPAYVMRSRELQVSNTE